MGICGIHRKKNIFRNPTINFLPENKENNSDSNDKSNNDDKPPTNIEGVTKASTASSTHEKIKPEIYSIKNFGVEVKTNQNLNEPLKFIFHFFNFKCSLSENRIYIMQIIFDGKEYPLSFGKGNNPLFTIDETIGKDISFYNMSSSYMEIILFTYKDKTKDVQFFKNMTKGEIMLGTQLFSCLKIDLLTLVISPEKHDFALIDPKRNRASLGRINYNISCKQIEDISIKIKNFKINLNNLNYNQIALNLKYVNSNLSIIKETEYTDNFHGTPNPKDNSMIYQYISEKEIMNSKKNSNNLIKRESKEVSLNEKIISKKIISMGNNDDLFFDNIDEYDDNNSISEKLKLHGKMSLNDIFNSQISLNIFSVGLKYRRDLEKIKNNNINFNYVPNYAQSAPRYSIEAKDLGLIKRKLDLINDYTLIGIVSLNFYKILYDNENRIEQNASNFFHTMSNQKYGDLNKTYSNSKINTKGIEQNLDEKIKKEYKEKENKEKNIIQNLVISAYENIIQNFSEEIINYDGESIGTIEMCLEIVKLPLIKQNMFGVLTEKGFQISSIFLYDNNNILNDLPEELLELIRLKEKFEDEISTNIQQIDFDKNISNIMLNIKSTLQKTIEKSCLYYGYSSNKDIYKGQEIIINLGLILFELIDKLGFEHRKIGFEILKLILKRSEIDLGTLSAEWFKTIKKSVKNNIINDNSNDIYEFDFRDNILLERGIIENFFKFHLEALNYSLDNLFKGKNSDNESRNFTNYYLSISYFLNPTFREELIKQIYSNIDLKNAKYLKCLKNMKKNIILFTDEENYNKAQSNFLLWDTTFYKKLDSSLNKYSVKMIDSNSKSNKYIKNINTIKEQLLEIKYITNGNNNKNDLSGYYTEKNWCNIIKTRSFIFYDYILELLTYILNILNKIDENNTNTKWTKIPGMDKILEVINYDLIIKDPKNYPKQIYEILPIFYSEISITNHLISSMILNTNIYDTQSIFTILNILDYLFNKKYLLNNFKNNIFKEKIDYKIIYRSFSSIIKTDNSLAIAKYIWFYYKNISLLSSNHINKVITRILIPYFYELFFHWSFQIREIFYFFLIYIINHKIKNLIKPHKIKENINQLKNSNIFGFFNIGIFGPNKDEKAEDKSKDIQKFDDKIFYFFGDLLDEKMKIIEQIVKIIDIEKYDLVYNNKINESKFKNIIEIIPAEYHSNIIISINHYNKVLNDFEKWDNNNKERKIEEKDIIYPPKEIMIIKDDTIQYNN